MPFPIAGGVDGATEPKAYESFCKSLHYEAPGMVVLGDRDLVNSDPALFAALFRPSSRDIGRLRKRSRRLAAQKWYEVERGAADPRSYIADLRVRIEAARRNDERVFVENIAAATGSPSHVAVTGATATSAVLDHVTALASYSPASSWFCELELRAICPRWAAVWYYGDTEYEVAWPMLIGFAARSSLDASVEELLSIPLISETYGIPFDAETTGNARIVGSWVRKHPAETEDELKDALREHLQFTLYPELAEDFDAVWEALTACADGDSQRTVEFANGRHEEAALVVVVLGLQDYLSALG
jgi:hypothetical protein